MKEPRLLPDLIEISANDLVDRVARRHRMTRRLTEVVIEVPGVICDGMPAGDYEVVIRRKSSSLGQRLQSLENPWMRMFKE